MAAGAVVVRGEADAAPEWAESLGAGRQVQLGARRPSPEAAEALGGAECAMVDGTSPDPVALARRVHSADPTLQVVMVAPPEERTRLQHALLFAPGLGEIWLVTPDQVDPELVERAGTITRQRRQYRSTRAELERGLAGRGVERTRRALISDAFLAALLQTAPDPVLSVDAEGKVLSWNPAAERILGYPAREAVGRDLPELIAPGDPEMRRLAAERADAVRGEVRFRARGGEEGIAEVLITPVEEAGEGIRSVILHDLTEERRAQAEMEAQAAELEEQAAEMEALNDELQERTRELEAALSSRSRFYAAMSHELRTPINAIVGYNALLLDEIYGPLQEKQAEGLRRAQRAARHLLELVNDVLDLAKIDAGRIELQVEPASFPQLLEELLDTVRSLAHEHGSTLALAGEEGSQTVVTDPRRVRQILLNLLSNAIKFGEGKPIDVAWSRTPDGGVEVRVTDRGVGIAPADVERIFHEFEQVQTEPGVGTGLGLPISLRLAQLLGGSLRVRSAPGEGSTFSLLLPPEIPAEDTRAG